MFHIVLDKKWYLGREEVSPLGSIIFRFVIFILYHVENILQYIGYFFLFYKGKEPENKKIHPT